jgi:hypothetical protein
LPIFQALPATRRERLSFHRTEFIIGQADHLFQTGELTNMAGIIEPETIHVDTLPGVWVPVQWEQTEQERIQEVETQARASLLATVDIPEAILRLLLGETGCDVVYGPPQGYDPVEQGEWDESLLTFAFNRSVRLKQVERNPDRLVVVYDFNNLGEWIFEITPEKVTIERY